METATNNFLNWLNANDVVVSSKITIKDLSGENQGRGVVALADIEADEILFELPQKSILNAETSSLVRDFPNFKAELFDLNQWEALILVFAYELFVKKNSSDWSDYFKVLPVFEESNYTFHQLMFWSEEELKKLEPSLISKRIGKNEAKDMYSKLQNIISQNNLAFDLSFDDFQKIATTIMSYSFDVEVPNHEEDTDESKKLLEDGYLKSMVPLADTLNADTELQNAHLVYTDLNLVMTSTKLIKAGEQVFNTYSDLSNAELLRRYGYVQNSGSSFDFGEIPLALIKKHFYIKYEVTVDEIDQIIDSIKKTVQLENAVNEYEDEVDVVLESYDVYKTKEIQTELIFLIQVLTIIFAMKVDIKESEDKDAIIGRIYKKCYQLIEKQKLTDAFKTNYESIIKARVEQYPKLDLHGQGRDFMAQKVIESELNSLLKCQDATTVMSEFSFIDDQKLIRNISKKRSSTETDEQNTKKKKAN